MSSETGKALAQLRADGAEVRIQHVRAHTGHGMNERADKLAAQGAQGLRRRDNAVYVPARAGRRASQQAQSQTER